MTGNSERGHVWAWEEGRAAGGQGRFLPQLPAPSGQGPDRNSAAPQVTTYSILLPSYFIYLFIYLFIQTPCAHCILANVSSIPLRLTATATLLQGNADGGAANWGWETAGKDINCSIVFFICISYSIPNQFPVYISANLSTNINIIPPVLIIHSTDWEFVQQLLKNIDITVSYPSQDLVTWPCQYPGYICTCRDRGLRNIHFKITKLVKTAHGLLSVGFAKVHEWIWTCLILFRPIITKRI